MNRSAVVRHPSSPFTVVDVAVDVGMEDLHFHLVIGSEVIHRSISNRTLDISMMLRWILAKAKIAGCNQLRIIVEPTGIYHELLLRIAEGMHLQTTFVSGEAVKKMRKVLFNDNGKTDDRDPLVIRDLASRNIVLKRRRLPETYQLLRRFNVVYETGEKGLIAAKCRIHRCLKCQFPDLDFAAGFVYSKSGRAIMKCYNFDPHAIKRAGATRVTKRLKALVPRIRKRTIERLIEYANASVQSSSSIRVIQVRTLELQQAWEDMETHEKRRFETARALEALYDEARSSDPNLPNPIKGVATKLALARLIGELGPLSDFPSWRQVLKMAGLNLCERNSGKFHGKTKISKTGRYLARKIINQMVLPIVKRTRLFGPYYHYKRDVEKMKGNTAMTAVARKLLKMLWGLYKSGEEFSAERVFSCQSAWSQAA